MPALRPHLRARAVGLGLVCLTLLGSQTWALTPKSPEVQRAVARAQKFLLGPQGAQSSDFGDSASHRIGAEAVVALALLKSEYVVKAGITRDHPRIKSAIDKIRKGIGDGSVGQGYEAVYATGLSIIFLAELGDTSYRNDISAALKILLRSQRAHGGFSPGAGSARGDTSMTQYAVLGMWDAAKAGVAAPPRAWQGVSQWLIQTQAANGGFSYNPPDSVTHSMTAAGAGMLYIIGDFARKNGSGGEQPKKTKPNDDNVPSALKPVAKKKKKDDGQDPKARVSINVNGLRGAMSRADAWMKNNFTVEGQMWPMYYLYAMERYHAFKDKWENQNSEEPDWYNQGAAKLMKEQQQDGSWNGGSTKPVNTAFGVLFLIRGTRIAVAEEPTAGGTLLSGSGLPADLTQIKLKGGEVVVKPLAGPAGELLDILDNPDDPRFLQAVEGFAELVIKADDIMLSPHLVRLKKLAKDGTPAARAHAVAALGKSRDLDYVPTLIYALRDDHPLVVKAARDGLRFVSRKFDGFGLKPDAEAKDKAKAIAKWKDWYRTVRPDAEFEE